MKFVMHRDRVVASVYGHAVEFKKGVATHVPSIMHKEVLAAGGIPEEELVDDAPKRATEPTDPVERANAIKAVITELLELGRREDFTAAGSPHAKIISAKLGWNVDNKERDGVWGMMQREQNEGSGE
jgi:hypothetical protein